MRRPAVATCSCDNRQLPAGGAGHQRGGRVPAAPGGARDGVPPPAAVLPHQVQGVANICSSTIPRHAILGGSERQHWLRARCTVPLHTQSTSHCSRAQMSKHGIASAAGSHLSVQSCLCKCLSTTVIADGWDHHGSILLHSAVRNSTRGAFIICISALMSMHGGTSSCCHTSSTPSFGLH